MPKHFFFTEAFKIQLFIWPIYWPMTLILNYHLHQERTVSEQLIALGMFIIIFNACTALFFLLFVRGRKWLVWLGLVVLFALSSSGVYHVVYRVMPKYGMAVIEPDRLSNGNKFFWEMLNNYLTLILAAGALVLHIRSKKNLIRKERETQARLEKEKEANASLSAMLGAQVDPHFVFNILADVQAQCEEKLPSAARTLGLLTDMWHDAQAHANKPIVIIEKEIDAVQRYLELECARFARCYVNFEIEGEACGQKIPPGMLRTCLENAFKYGYRSVRDKPIEAKLTLMDDGFRFVCCNWINPNRKHMRSTGLGLNNTRRRLELLFPDTHEMNVSETADGIFTVEITILENEGDTGSFESGGAG